MFLYLVRHGEANKQEDDEVRSLTDKGFREASLTADYARDRGVRPEMIYHSKKKRALQTAQIFSGYLKPDKGIAAADGLAPMDEPKLWAARIAEMTKDIMLVGHLPYLARLCGLLLVEDEEKIFLDFKPGGLVCLQRSDDDLEWTLEWMVTPDIVASLAGSR